MPAPSPASPKSVCKRPDQQHTLQLASKSALYAALLVAPTAGALAAEVTLPPVSVGAGIRSSFTHVDFDSIDDDVDDFELDSARLYFSGKVTDYLSIMFNTEYGGGDEQIRVIDAAAQFSFGDQFNIWAGRFLPPSDRANLYGPYYASHWGTFQDGVQDGYPFETTGRDDGVMYWGQFGVAKVSFGLFDVEDLTKGTSDVLSAGRVQLDFWDPEAGYYLNGTYYGDKDLLAVGLAAQNAGGDNAYSLDFLLEKKISGAGVVTVEAEYAKYDGLGGYFGDESDGWYVLGAYLFPQEVGIGRFQPLVKFGTATFEFTGVGDVDQDTLELDLNYIMKQFNARLSLFYIDTDIEGDGFKQIGLGLQVQM
jgi:hypothetical protein